MNNDTVVAGIGALFLVLLGTFAIILFCGGVFAVPVMLLWNWLLHGPQSILGVSLPEIGFWQAWGLYILCGLLLKSNPANNSNNTK